MFEAWLRIERRSCVSALQGHDVYTMKVKDLMLTNGKQLDVQKIKQLFTHEVVKEIEMGLYKKMLVKIVWFRETNKRVSIV